MSKVSEAKLYAAKIGWELLLSDLAPELKDAVDAGGDHVYCPQHGGKHGDAFKILDDYRETGGCACNSCGVMKDGVATLAFIRGITQGKAVGLILKHRDENGFAVEAVKREYIPPPPKPKATPVKKVVDMWERATPLAAHGLGMAYFRSRGIPTSAIPKSLREIRRLSYSVFDRVAQEVEYLGSFPAILAPIWNRDGELVAVNRTYIDKDGEKLVIFDKHGVQRDPKKLSETNGELDEIVVKLFEATGPVLVLCEGIETALAVRAATGLPVWATLSTNNYAGVVIPDQVSTVLFFADRDLPVIPTTPNGRHMPLGAGHWWASAAAKNLEAAGKTCHVLLSPELPEQEKTDWLDAWNIVGLDAFDLQEIDYVYEL